jgi:hypothetical protein
MFIAVSVLLFFQAPSGARCHMPPLTGLGREETVVAINISLLRSEDFSNSLQRNIPPPRGWAFQLT